MDGKRNSNSQSVEQPLLMPKEKKEASSEYQKFDEPKKTIRIAVSGNVILTEREVLIIDTPEFQKLRKYRQLGSSYLVYPSANHTRFEHSLGVLYMAEAMMTAIEHNPKSTLREKNISENQRRVTRLVALLHDIANLPFGHTLEDETNVIKSNQDDSQRLKKALGLDTTIGRILAETLNDDDYQLLFDVLLAKETTKSSEKDGGPKSISDLKGNAFMVDIVKNTVCADLLDYLKRDSYFCNIDLESPNTFLNYLFINDESEDVRRVAIRLWKNHEERPRQAIISELVQLLETRYFLAERVYFHHAKQISSTMIASAVYHALNQGKDALTLQRLSELGDDELLNELTKPEMNPITKKLAFAYCNRRLYKQIYSLSMDQIVQEEQKKRLDYLKNEYHDNADNRALKEKEICEVTGLLPGSILIYCPNPDMNMKTAEMKVTWKGNVTALRSITDKLVIKKIESIKESHEKLWQLQVFVSKEIKDNSQKTDLVSIYCKKLFEGYDDPEGDITQLALRKVVEDCINEIGAELSLPFCQSVVSFCMEKNRDGLPFSREEIMRQIREKSTDQKT